MIAAGAWDGKKSEKLENDIWSEIVEPPVESNFWQHASIFHNGYHYYFGGDDGTYLKSILGFKESSMSWKNFGQLKADRVAHKVIMVGDRAMVVGGTGNGTHQKNEACDLYNGRFSCTQLTTGLNNYQYYPILYPVDVTYENC